MMRLVYQPLPRMRDLLGRKVLYEPDIEALLEVEVRCLPHFGRDLIAINEAKIMWVKMTTAPRLSAVQDLGGQVIGIAHNSA